MKPGDMLGRLHEVEERLSSLLDAGPSAWESLDIDYEPPRVERLWLQLGDLRVNLHRIHPCETALYHPHPWPSAIRILSGTYEMGIGYLTPVDKINHRPVNEAARVVLVEDAEYEMIEAYGWHYVRPLGQPSLSLMVTGKPWPALFSHAEFGKAAQLRPLTDEAKAALLDDFQFHWHDES